MIGGFGDSAPSPLIYRHRHVAKAPGFRNWLRRAGSRALKSPDLSGFRQKTARFRASASGASMEALVYR
jgi:hypothetical protein